MAFIRPEVFAALSQWREVIFWGIIACLGLYLFNLGGPVFALLGAGCLGAGLGFGLTAFKRTRFPSGQGGVGVVEVTERQITYFSPSGGGAVSLDNLARIEIQTTPHGPYQDDLFWVFFADGEPSLTIPGNAENIDALFDALSVLNGVDYAAITDAASSVEQHVFVIWYKDRARLH